MEPLGRGEEWEKEGGYTMSTQSEEEREEDLVEEARTSQQVGARARGGWTGLTSLASAKASTLNPKP
jgi:hypothetical protein